MIRKKTILLASACIVLGMVMAGPAAQAAEELLTAVHSTHQFYLDGQSIGNALYTGTSTAGHCHTGQRSAP